MRKVIGSLWVKLLAALIFAASVMMFGFGSSGLLILDETNLPWNDPDNIRTTLYENVACGQAYQLLDDMTDNGMEDRDYDIAPAIRYVVLKSKVKLSTTDLYKGEYDNKTVVAGSLEDCEVSGIVYGQKGWDYEVYDSTHAFYSPYCSANTPLGYYDYNESLKHLDNNTDKYYILYSIDYGAAEGTIFQEADITARYLIWCMNNGATLIVFSFITAVVSLVVLIWGAKSTMYIDNKIPYALLMGITGFAELGVMSAVAGIFNLFESFRTIMMLSLLMAAVGAIIFVYFAMNTATRIKAHAFMKNTLTHYLLLPVKALVKLISENLSLTAKAILFSVVLGVIQVLGLICVYSRSDVGAFLFLIYKAIEVIIFIWLAVQFDRVRRGMAQVAAGQSDASIDTSFMLPAFKMHSDNISNVSEGINKAVDEKLKSERMKTELITNVSHDIKTPLTSIINYVDLMEKHGTEDPEMQEYLEVLQRQSGRLKKLIEDLIEASKASSGAIEMTIDSVNVSVLLSQVEGEFEEKLKAKGLTLVGNTPDEEQMIRADGRYLWRVIDNLINNICKYSMENTRVYMDLIPQEDRTEISIKNISANELNITPEELTERFVRGDQSRNSEGSGLGLSIAKSLTEHMGGTLDIGIDGDLFKVTLTFPKA